MNKKELKLQITKLFLTGDDIVIIKTNDFLDQLQLDSMKESLLEVLPPISPIIILNGNMTLEKISREELEGLLKH